MTRSYRYNYLDWFHITMRLTAMGQYAKGLDTTQEKREETLESLESVKRYLSHVNVGRARDKDRRPPRFLG